METLGVGSGQGQGAGRQETGGQGQVPWRAKTGRRRPGYGQSRWEVVMEREDRYAPRGRRAGARGCLDHSQSSRREGVQDARRRSLWGGVGPG